MTDLGWRFGVGLIGPFLGTFIATFAANWPRLPRPILGASRCGACGATLGLGSLLPIVSYFRERGERACCAGRIPWVYPAGEMGGLLVGVSAALQPDARSAGVILGAGSCLLYAALVDLRRYSIPWASVFGLLAVLLTAAALGGPAERIGTAATVLIVGGLLLTVRLLGTPKAGRPAVAWGDILLASLVCGLAGPVSAWAVIAGAAISALVVQRLRRSSAPVPFGAYLAGSGFLVIASRALLTQ